MFAGLGTRTGQMGSDCSCLDPTIVTAMEVGAEDVGVFVWVETGFSCSYGLHTLIHFLHKDKDSKLVDDSGNDASSIGGFSLVSVTTL